MGSIPSQPSRESTFTAGEDYQGNRRRSTVSSEDSECLSTTLTKQAELLGYPPPRPPRSRKADIFHIGQYKDLDQHASKVPIALLYKSYKDLVDYLARDAETDLQTVRVLFQFLASIDVSSLEGSLSQLPEAGTPLDYLLKIHWQMGNHAHFFAQMARAARLPCLVISGINKSAAYRVGEPVNAKAMAAQWNAVLVDGEWRLLDVFWASTVLVGKSSKEWALFAEDDSGEQEEEAEEEEEAETLHVVNEFFFLTDPDMIICTHFPDDPEWQLLPEPISAQQFELYVYIRERFFQLDMELMHQSHQRCVITTDRGEVTIKFALPENIAKTVQFQYLLFKSRHTGEATANIDMDRFVFYQKSTNLVSYTARFPIAGKFKFDIFGRDPDKHENLDLVCSYLIECNDPQQIHALPDCPDIGWGPGIEAEEKGLKATSHQDAVIETEDGRISIKFHADNPMAMVQNLKNNQLNELLLNRFAVVRSEADELIVDLRLPQQGEYALGLYADDENHSGDLDNVCNYLINCNNPNIKATPYPRLHEGVLGSSPHGKRLGVVPTSHPDGLIVTDDGKVSIVFDHDTSKEELFCELHNNTMDQAALAHVITSHSNNITGTTFDLSLPSAGEYALNVYSSDKGDKDGLFHVHSYLIQSNQSGTIDVKKTTARHDISTIHTDKDQIQIETRDLADGGAKLLGELQRKNAVQAPTSQVCVTTEGDTELFNVKLQDEGEYKFDVFEAQGNGALVNVATYQIIRDIRYKEADKPPTPEVVLSPEELEARKKQAALEVKYKRYREQLRVAVRSQDPAALHHAIKEHQANKVPEQKGDISNAKQLLDCISISQELTSAMGSRTLARLEDAVQAAERAHLHGKLGLQLQMARRIIEQLKRIESLRHAIMKLDQRTIAEIKSYATPPEAVHQVMAATCLLLGENVNSVKSWKAVQVLIGKTGREGIKRRVSEFNVEKLPIQVAGRVKVMLSKFPLDMVRDVSSGAATFYVWSMGMVEEQESRFSQTGGDLRQVQAKESKRDYTFVQ